MESINPLGPNVVPQLLRSGRLRVAVYEVQDIQSDIIQSLMLGLQKCLHVSIHFGLGDHMISDLIVVFACSGHELALSLSHILHVAPSAFKTVNEFRAFTRYIGLGLGGVRSTRRLSGNLA